jgi:hypothetical protein
MNLVYRSFVAVGAIGLDECTIHRAGHPSVASSGARWWNLWFNVLRSDGVQDAFVVPINPNGAYEEYGAGGRTWGFTKTGIGVWQVTPSINVLEDRATVGAIVTTVRSLWHQTPAVVGVPENELWIAETP